MHEFYKFDDEDETQICFEKYSNQNYIIGKARKDSMEKVGVDQLNQRCKNFGPDYLSEET